MCYEETDTLKGRGRRNKFDHEINARNFRQRREIYFIDLFIYFPGEDFEMKGTSTTIMTHASLNL